MWRPPADLPRRWLNAYASATADAWSAVSPRWRRAQSLLDLEARRVGAAVVRGGTDVLLNTLHPRIRYENGEIWVPATRELTVGLDGRRLVLVPTIAGSAGRLVGFDCPTSSTSPTRCPGRPASASIRRPPRRMGRRPAGPGAGPHPGPGAASGHRADQHGTPRGRARMQPAHDHLSLRSARIRRADPARTPRPIRLGQPHHSRARTHRPAQRVTAPTSRGSRRPRSCVASRRCCAGQRSQGLETSRVRVAEEGEHATNVAGAACGHRCLGGDCSSAAIARSHGWP